MCDFHSVIVTGVGRILHNVSNSHSGIAAQYSLESGLDAKWWECEWDGRGDMPLVVDLVQSRGKESSPTQTAYRAAEAHYSKLAEIMAVDADESTVFPYPFNQPEYEDVRTEAMAAVIERERRAAAEAAAAVRKQAIAEAEAEANAVAEKFEAAFIGFNHDQEIAFMRHLIENSALSCSIEDVAEDEIHAARDAADEWDSDHPAYQAGLESGYESASEDMYSHDYVCGNIRDFIKDKDIPDLFEDELSESRDEGYALGYRDAKQGKAAAVDYSIDGMPSFLF